MYGKQTKKTEGNKAATMFIFHLQKITQFTMY